MDKTPFKIQLLSINIILLVIMLNSCCLLTIPSGLLCNHYESTGYDPIHSAITEFPIFCSEPQNSALIMCNDIKERLGNTILQPYDRLHIKTQKVLDKVLSAYYEMETKRKIYSFYGDAHQRKPNIRLLLYALDEAIATSFPNGEIHLATSMINGSKMYSAENEAQVAAIIAHELIHILHLHLCAQWKISDGLKDFQKKVYYSNFTKLTRLIPITYIKEVYSTRNLSELFSFWLATEYLADFNTVLILEQLRYNPNEYIKFLSNLKKYSVKNADNKNKQAILYYYNNRIKCLKKLINFIHYQKKYIFPEYFIVENKHNKKEKAFRIVDPIVKRHILYWIFALPKLGYETRIGTYVMCDDNTYMTKESSKNSKKKSFIRI